MLRIIQNTSAAGAKAYYSTASTADYYTQGQELVGLWRGEGAARLGLSGEVERNVWDTLCDNKNPATGASLTPRQKDPRRVGYDFNFHVPKSVSVLYGLTRDERLLDAFRASVGETMRDMESEMQTRVRAGGMNEDRTTANMVWGEFIHFTARPVDGVPDPHLHAHCFVFNTTWDDKESRWKAGQFAGLKRDAPYFEAVFHSRLARRMEELGLDVERTKFGWEIAGLSTSTLDRFSRRTALIEALAEERGVVDPREKDALGAQTRQRKAKAMSMDALRREWVSRLNPDEQEAITRVHDHLGAGPINADDRAAPEAARLAIDHCFERSAVVPERTVLVHALKHSVGKASPERVAAAVASHDLIRRERGGRWLVTTPSVLAEERAMLDFARNGRGTCRPLGRADYQFSTDTLSAEQQQAVLHVLTSKDRVIVVRGAAGTGKTTMMREAVAGIEAGHGEGVGGKQVFTFAPSASASRGVLRSAGFATAETVARLLVDQDLQEQARNQVLWIDEVGLLGSRTTAELFGLAGELNVRVILSGDKRQHGSVERGGVLRLLETEAGIVPAELREIRRQSGAYKSAVRNLSEGRVIEGFEKLDDLGWIKEIGDQERYRVLADEYVKSTQQPGQTLVVCPTHAESDTITAEIRAALKANGSLSALDRSHTILRPVNLTQAERADALSYRPGDVLVFHQNARGRKKGDRLIAGRDALPLDQAARFTVFRPATLGLSAGDRVRITKNFKSTDGSVRLNNGDLHGIRSIGRDGSITLDNKDVLPADFGHLDYGYVVTSHASQGKSVERVIIGQSSDSFPASSKEQFYVSVSRGKQKATIFTDHKHALLEAVSNGDDRITATDLVGGHGGRGGERTRPARAPVRSIAPHRRRVPHLALHVPPPPPPVPQREGMIHDR